MLSITGDKRANDVEIVDQTAGGLTSLTIGGVGVTTDQFGNPILGIDFHIDIQARGGVTRCPLAWTAITWGRTKTYTTDLGTGSDDFLFSTFDGLGGEFAIDGATNLVLEVLGGRGADEVDWEFDLIDNSSMITIQGAMGSGNDDADVEFFDNVDISTVRIDVSLGSGNNNFELETFEELNTSQMEVFVVGGSPGKRKPEGPRPRQTDGQCVLCRGFPGLQRHHAELRRDSTVATTSSRLALPRPSTWTREARPSSISMQDPAMIPSASDGKILPPWEP